MWSSVTTIGGQPSLTSTSAATWSTLRPPLRSDGPGRIESRPISMASSRALTTASWLIAA
jgi:hypothetical protein